MLMSKKPFHYLLLVNCLLGALSPLYAQGDSSGDDLKGKTMRVVSFGAEMHSVFYEHKGKKMELYAGMSYLSDPMPLPKGGVLKIFQERQQPSEDGTEQVSEYVNVGNVPLVDGAEVLVLLSVPENLGTEKIKGRSYKDSLAIHSSGTARVFNLSDKVVGVRAGKDALKLPVGDSGVMPWKAVAYNSVAYKIATQGKEEDSWNLIQSSECASPPDMRTFVFVSVMMIDGTKTVNASTFLDPIPIRGGDDTP